MPRPNLPHATYNQNFNGFFGHFGTEANAQIYFLQTGIRPSDLDKIALISEIPGSEKWNVRDLFQREVDIKRVLNNILPYLQDARRVKFFNPLTLTILPIDEETYNPLTDISFINESSFKDQDGYDWMKFEFKNYYRYRYVKDQPHYGVIDALLLPA